MDTSDYPSLPDLGQLNARLATNSRRVEAVIDSQIDSIELLLSAATAEDWQSVARISRYLADTKADLVGLEVVREAQHVFDEVSQRVEDGPQPVRLPNLLAACRTVRKNWTSLS
ncbi:MAG: hypothetical protein AAGD11_16135 [Planctomycetota bacterium]